MWNTVSTTCYIKWHFDDSECRFEIKINLQTQVPPTVPAVGNNPKPSEHCWSQQYDDTPWESRSQFLQLLGQAEMKRFIYSLII